MGADPTTGTGRTDAAEGDRPPLVLVVDDEAAMRERCARVLEERGFEVITAPGEAEALEALSRRQPDLMVVDLRMPGMSGEEFLAAARDVDPEVVAVAIAGCPTPCAAVEEIQAGASDFVPSTFEADQLALVVDRALEKRRLTEAVLAGERERRRMRDHFVAMVSHQLKSPAATAKECLDAALGAFGERVPGGCRDLMSRAARKAGLLLDLMDDWLTLARLESGALPAAAEPIDLRAVVESAVDAARETPHRNEVAVGLEEPEGAVRVEGDAEALRELIFNLVDNAVRYTPDGGEAAVEFHTEGRYAVVCVSDTGPGIPGDELPVIFEPFFRGGEARSRDGTGLGLSIAKQIAEAHGGHIAVHSTPGEGTTFRVYLPLAEAAAGG